MKLTVRKTQTNPLVYQIPLLIAVLFAAGMIFLAVISTDKARESYKALVFQKNIRNLAGANPINIPNFPFNKATPTPTPTPSPTPANFREQYIEFSAKYEPNLLFISILLLIPGLRFLWMCIGGVALPKANPFSLTDALRRNLLAMIASFILSPALFFLYIWTLRVGLI